MGNDENQGYEKEGGGEVPAGRRIPTLAAESRDYLRFSRRSIGLCACRLRVDAEASFHGSAGKFLASGETKAPERWWEAFEDEELNGLVERAMADNLDVLTAWDRLDQAVAIAGIAGSPQWPDVNAGYSVTDTDVVGGAEPFDAADPFGGADAFIVEDTFHGVSLTASYEVDLWGRIRSGRNAAGSDLRASREDLNTVAITISAEIARTWFELLEQRSQLDILTEQADVNRTYLDLLELRFNQGQTAAAEVLQQRQQLAAIEGETPLVESRVEVLEHGLAVLLGAGPALEVPDGDEALPELPLLPETGLPAELLLRRPDVRSARLRLEAADYRVGEAMADRLPRVTARSRASSFRSAFPSKRRSAFRSESWPRPTPSSREEAETTCARVFSRL